MIFLHSIKVFITEGDGVYVFNVGIKFLRATLPHEIFREDFASWTVHFFNICVNNQQTHQLFIQLIMYGSSYMFRHYIAILRERS
jgi:hypothetical protein